MTKEQNALCSYRISRAEETLKSAMLCLDNHFFRDAVNRSYYAAFYAVKAVLALENIDFKRHKDVVAYFNHHYVATGIFNGETGRLLSRLQKKRESGDYDDFFVVSNEEAAEQMKAAECILGEVKKYLEIKYEM